MKIPLQNLRAQYDEIRTEIALALGDVLERQDFILGREVVELEEKLAPLCGRRFAIACASCSDALALALTAVGVGPGDEVLVPAFTFFATAGCVARMGARPRFVDIDQRTFNMDPGKLPNKAGLETGAPKKPRAIIPVDLFGQVAEMEKLAAGAEVLIEDAAQAVLASRNGRPAGSFGAVSVLSFYPTKNLGAYGDAGMLLTDDPALAEKLRRLRNHGQSSKYVHQDLGVNSRMDTFQAAVLLVKLRRLGRWTGQRVAAAGVYDRLFRESGLVNARGSGLVNDSVEIPAVAAGNRHVYHQYTIRVPGPGGRRDALRSALEEQGIGTGVYYPLPLHLQPCFAHLGGKAGDFPESERAAGQVLSLPLFPQIKPEEQERVVEAVARFLRGSGE